MAGKPLETRVKTGENSRFESLKYRLIAWLPVIGAAVAVPVLIAANRSPGMQVQQAPSTIKTEYDYARTYQIDVNGDGKMDLGVTYLNPQTKQEEHIVIEFNNGRPVAKRYEFKDGKPVYFGVNNP